jgi:hypothetical protein
VLTVLPIPSRPLAALTPASARAHVCRGPRRNWAADSFCSQARVIFERDVADLRTELEQVGSTNVPERPRTPRRLCRHVSRELLVHSECFSCGTPSRQHALRPPRRTPTTSGGRASCRWHGARARRLQTSWVRSSRSREHKPLWDRLDYGPSAALAAGRGGGHE